MVDSSFEKFYEYLSKKIRFEESDDADAFEKAETARAVTVADFSGSVSLQQDEALTCSLLQRNLDAYSSTVDDTRTINNYIDKILEILPGNSAAQKKPWRSTITASEILDLIPPLPCADDKINCRNSKITPGAYKELQQARASYEEEKKREARRKVPENSKEEMRPRNSVVMNNFGQENLAPKNSQIKFGPPKVTQPPANKTVPTFQPKNVFKPFEHQKSFLKSVEQALKNNAKPEPPQKNFFKTASEGLRLQNAQKFGKSDGSQFGNRRTPGLSKSASVTSSFQNPYGEKKKEAPVVEVSENSEVNELAGDERLKNVDPKMVETILNEIVYNGVTVTWDDIAGLEYAKNTIQEVVVWPMLRPDIFTGLRRPPRGILLFGPPGTGKTLIGKCIAFESGATFFSISASSLTSKWIGECEKMVRALFAVARVKQPSVVFIDEIDSILTQRSDTEHESSRRMKTEFLVQLDGVGTGDEDRILIIGATNRPQELDEAARRRLVKRLYVPLPETKARVQMIQNIIKDVDHKLSMEDIEQVAAMTEGYSGADMMCVCKEAAYEPIRSLPRMQIKDISSNQVRPVEIADFTTALTRVRATVSQSDLHQYLAWDKQFGSGSM